MLPPPQAAGARYCAMDADEDEGEAPAAERPPPLREVRPQAGAGRHGGIGSDLLAGHEGGGGGGEGEGEGHDQ